CRSWKQSILLFLSLSYSPAFYLGLSSASLAGDRADLNKRRGERIRWGGEGHIGVVVRAGYPPFGVKAAEKGSPPTLPYLGVGFFLFWLIVL
uniref:Uncharacterized protein n=1 Tax=Xenopus tropicalis TaxID=8364 RepID=A0A803J5C2_XENTR